MRLTLKIRGHVPYTDVSVVSEVDVALNDQPAPTDEIINGTIRDLKRRVEKDIEAELARRGIKLDAEGKKVTGPNLGKEQIRDFLNQLVEGMPFMSLMDVEVKEGVCKLSYFNGKRSILVGAGTEEDWAANYGNRETGLFSFLMEAQNALLQ